jgi:hypothetical protein
LADELVALGMSITGVDNTDLGATQAPGLSNIRTPIAGIGRIAANYLIARLDGDEWNFPRNCRSRSSCAEARALPRSSADFIRGAHDHKFFPLRKSDPSQSRLNAHKHHQTGS